MGSNGEEEALMKLMDLATCHVVPMALRAAMELNVMEILAKHGGQHGYLSPSQIVSHFETPLASSTSHEQASSSLNRILRVLASNGVLTSSLLISPHEDEEPITTYALNSLSHFLVQHNGQASLAPFLRSLIPTMASCRLMLNMHEFILDGIVPFTKANGTTPFSYLQENPQASLAVNHAFAAHSRLFMYFLLNNYHGFDHVTNLVDVGGGIGASLGVITSKHPHIKGINFDLPHVVAGAPEYPGVEHVAGDMFEMVPKADVIFMKWILHDWSDVNCLKILENCNKALPNGGKVIVVDAVLPEETECGLSTRLSYGMDIRMLLAFDSKERTKRELERISKASGFARLEVVCHVLGCGVVEIHKEVTTS